MSVRHQIESWWPLPRSTSTAFRKSAVSKQGYRLNEALVDADVLLPSCLDSVGPDLHLEKHGPQLATSPDDAVHNDSCVDPETTEILLDQILCAECTLPPSPQGENG